MNLDDLQTFMRVAELGSLSAAAREHNAPTSQISRAIVRLETKYAVRLLHRSTHSLSLTEAGQALLTRGRAMLEQLALYEEDVQQDVAVAGTVRLAASAAMTEYVIMPGLTELARLHPQLAIDLQVDDRLLDMAQQGIDLAVRTGDPGSEALVARKIGEHGRRLYAAPSYIAHRGMPATMAALHEHQLITNSVQPQLNRWPFQIKGQAQVLQARGFYKANSTGTMLSMALAGLGIVRGNTAICEPLVAQGRLVRVLDKQVECLYVPIQIVMLHERYRSRKLRACIDFFAQWFSQSSTGWKDPSTEMAKIYRNGKKSAYQ